MVRYGAGTVAALLASIAGLAVLAGGCGLASDAANAGTAPLAALPATDVVVATNLETALTFVGTGAGGGGGAGPGFVTGPSTGPSVTSYASRPGVVVLAAWNNVSRDCLGIADVTGQVAVPVLGESSPGRYYFVQRTTPSTSCSAAAFIGEPRRPSSWPSGDPSTSSFPISS